MNATQHNATAKRGNHVPSFDPVLDWIVLRIRLRAQRRVLWLRHLWESGDMGEKNALNIHEVVDHVLQANDTPTNEAAWYEETPSLLPLNEQLREVEDAIATDETSRFKRMVFLFGLNEVEVDLLQTCLALHLDPELERVFSYLQDHTHRGYVTAMLVAKLFAHPYNLASHSLHSLFTWELVASKSGNRTEPAMYQCDAHIALWLLGKDPIDEHLIGKAKFIDPKAVLADWPFEEAQAYCTRLFQQNAYQRIRLRVQGAIGGGRKTFAATLAWQFGQPLMVVDLDKVAPDAWTKTYIRAQRMAYLGGFALAWTGEKLMEQTWPELIAPIQLQFLIHSDNTPPKPIKGVVDISFTLSPLRIETREKLWYELVPASSKWAIEDFDHIVKRYKVTVGQLVEVAEKGVESPEEAREVLRASTRHRLGKLAQVLDCPFSWDDLVLSDSLKRYLEDFVFEARTRESLWERPEAKRIFPHGKGLMALFTGSPGTGKTMAAQVIADELALDLFRIDLSSVISKYIGETSKHIDQILSEAKHMHALLLFDEADTLFGKRTDIKDAHDRYANSDTNYLLQAIEHYPGVAILASNKKSNIDSAFLRRLRYVFDFPKPNAEQRQAIWTKVMGELVDKEEMNALEVPLRKLAKQVELTGAQIKNSILSALFISQREGKPLGMNHLLLGLERELMKEGRRISLDAQKRIKN